MCGRFSLFQISEFLNQYNIRFEEPLKPRYNISPSQQVPILVGGEGKVATWGLQFKSLVINTRVETYQEKPFFNHIQRVLVPADGFYEWKDGQPYRIETGRVFTMAGLMHKGGFSIITMPPNATIKKVHDRMPAVLADEEAWVKKGTIEPQKKFRVFEVSKLVSNPKNDIPEVIQPI